VLPFFAVAAALALVDVWFQKHGTGQVFRNAGLAERLLAAGAVPWFYLAKAAWPANLTFVYPEWHVSAGNPLWWAPLIATAGLTAILWTNRRKWSRPALFAWGYFCVALVPVMGFTDVYFMKYSLVADRYAEVAIIGAFSFAAFCLAKVQAVGRAILPARAGAAAAIAVLGLLTWRQCAMYRDARTLFLATLERNPGCWMACNYLGSTEPQARLADSIAWFERALQIRPDYAEARDNLGVALVRAGRLAEARAQFEEEARQEPENPRARANLEWVRRLQDGL
jgi:tetratricopeptide (TPR) repeat protein